MDKRIENEAKHFDEWVTCKASEVIFYDTPFVKKLLKDLENKAFALMGELTGRKVLYYGCGSNLGPILRFIECGCKSIHAIDISPKCIETVRKGSIELGFSEKIHCEVMDCMHLKYNDESFDIVYGRAILHHLNLKEAVREIKRVLKERGKAVFVEPLGMNPFLNLYRKLTPDRRTPDEQPLTSRDLKVIEFGEFREVTYDHFTLMSCFGVASNTILKLPYLRAIKYEWLRKMDDLLLEKAPFMKKLCWNVIIKAVR